MGLLDRRICPVAECCSTWTYRREAPPAAKCRRTKRRAYLDVFLFAQRKKKQSLTHCKDAYTINRRLHRVLFTAAPKRPHNHVLEVKCHVIFVAFHDVFVERWRSPALVRLRHAPVDVCVNSAYKRFSFQSLNVYSSRQDFVLNCYLAHLRMK